MPDVLAIGNALVDILVKLPDDSVLSKFGFAKGSMQLVDLNEVQSVLNYTKGNPVFQASGGSAANTIHGLAKLGVATTYIGKTGNDELGAFFRNDMQLNAINPQLFYSKTSTGRAVALVSPDSERTFATYLGAAVELSDIDLRPELFAGHKYFHVEGYLVQNHSLLEKALKLAREHHLINSLDMASFNVVDAHRDFLQQMIKEYVDIVFANEEEARIFTGKNPADAALAISELCRIAVVKLGEQGAIVVQNHNVCKINAIKVTPVDTTGAGDLFAAGFIYGLIHQWPMAACAEAGAILGGHVIEVIGSKMDNQRWARIIESVKKIKI